MRRVLTVVALTIALCVGTTIAVAATLSVNLNVGDNAAVSCPQTGKLTKTAANPYTWTVKCRNTTSPSPTSSPSPTTTPDPSPTPTPDPSPSPTTGGGFSCTAQLGDNCGPYDAGGIPMSNGFDTYVSNQPSNVHGTETVNANSPSDWNVVANLSDCGGCVQTFPDVQQLTNDWNGSGWGGGSQDTPWRQLSTIKVNYNETSPQTGASYEFAPDIWGPGGWDIMFWVDTHGRCNEGAYGPSTLGHYTDPSGASWTVHRYDPSQQNTGYTDNEIIIVLDGPGGPGTCAQQSSGTIDVKAGLDWLWNNGFITGTTMSQFNTGWEITQANNATFTVNDYSITAQ